MTREGTASEGAPIEEAVHNALRRFFDGAKFPFILVKQTDTEELLANIKKLLAEQQVRSQCRLADEDASGATRLLMIGGQRKEPLKDLRQWIKGASRLVIADPYFMHGDPTSWNWSGISDKEKKKRAKEYAEEIKTVFGDVKTVEIFHLPGPPREVSTAMRKVVFAQRNVQYFPTTEIHDRVWIKDGEDARIVGTSFGGIGRKLSFMLDLPDEDRKEFEAALARIRSATSGTP